MRDFFSRRNMHGRWEGIVRALAAINMIIWVNRIFGANLAAQNFNGEVRDHFIRIHIGLCTRACLPNGEREVVIHLAFSDHFGGFDDGASAFLIQIVELHIGLRRAHFDNAKRCLLYTSPSPRDRTRSRMPSSA